MIPFALTRITITRPSDGVDVDPGDTDPTWSVVASGVRATITVPAGASMLIASHTTVNNATVYVDPGVDILPKDEVTDESTGDIFTVLNLNQVYALIPHVSAEIRQKTSVTA